MNVLGASELSAVQGRPLPRLLAVWPGAGSEHLVCLSACCALSGLLQLWSQGWQESRPHSSWWVSAPARPRSDAAEAASRALGLPPGFWRTATAELCRVPRGRLEAGVRGAGAAVSVRAGGVFPARTPFGPGRGGQSPAGVAGERAFLDLPEGGCPEQLGSLGFFSGASCASRRGPCARAACFRPCEARARGLAWEQILVLVCDTVTVFTERCRSFPF